MTRLTSDGTTSLTRAETAAHLVRILTRAGVTFGIDPNGSLRVNLDALPFPWGDCSADDLARILSALRDEITALLWSARLEEGWPARRGGPEQIH